MDYTTLDKANKLKMKLNNIRRAINDIYSSGGFGNITFKLDLSFGNTDETDDIKNLNKLVYSYLVELLDRVEKEFNSL